MVAVGAWKENRHRELRAEYFAESIPRRVVRSTLLRVAPQPIIRSGEELPHRKSHQGSNDGRTSKVKEMLGRLRAKAVNLDFPLSSTDMKAALGRESCG